MNYYFDLQRSSIGWRNGIRVTLQGWGERTTTGTTIKVKLRLHPVSLVFLSLWSMGLMVFTFGILFQEGAVGPWLLGPTLMFSLFYGLVMACYNREHRLTKNSFERIFREPLAFQKGK